MQLPKHTHLIVIIMVSLPPLSACQSSTASSTARASLPGSPKQRNFSQFVSERKPMSHTERKQPAVTNRDIKLFPVDEGLQEPSFRVFREELLTAARKRDTGYVLSILSPQILNSLGGDGGIEEFKQQWRPDHPDSELWDTLITILSNGGGFEVSQGERLFCAPYVSSQWRHIIGSLPTDSDTLDYAAINDRDIAMRQEPSSKAPIVASLSYDVVKVGGGASVFDASLKDSYTWIKVTTLAGVEGYVSAKYIQSPTDYHACFKRAGEKWTMTILSGGE
jgi:hypothetical protein